MNKFDQLLNQIQDENPGSADAAARVRQKLFGPRTSGVGQIRGCGDFHSLIPSYLQRTLSDGRRMLLEDHVRECVACRKALEAERSGGTPKVVALPVAPKQSATPKWAIAAAILVGTATTIIGARHWLPYFDRSPRATVQNVSGMLYRQGLPIGEATELQDGDEVRTAAGARAVLRLFDGSRVEMNERARLSVVRSWRGTTIRMDRGHIIVQAAKQKQGKLFVSTADAQVAVVGTIFSVNSGTQGSRVSVVEGQVQVDHGGRSESLKPGQQTTSNPALGKVPVEAEIAWSRDAARYMALLGELNVLQKSLERIPSAGLRFQSRLLVYVPEDTSLFAAIPNIGTTLGEAKRIFDERVRMSEVLRQWWDAPENKKLRVGVEFLIDQLRELSSYLGDEVVLNIGGVDPGAVMMAEVRSPAVKEVLDRLIREASGNAPFVYSVHNNILLIASSAARLRQAEHVVARGGAASTALRQRIEQSYRSGAGWLMVANLEQIIARSVHLNMPSGPVDPGFNNVQFLTVERRDIAGRTENSAIVSFNGPRQGIPAWLAAPGPMNTLSFVSPEAGAAAGLVVKQPRVLLEEALRMAPANAGEEIAKFELATGVRVMDDIAGSLGAEATFALDGPLFPLPAWKVVLEVNSPQRLQASIGKILEAWNKRSGQPALVLNQEQANSRTYYKVTGGRLPMDVHYTYEDSYLLIAANRNLLTQAIQGRQTGINLPRSEKFRSQLPYGTNPNFSALFYHDLGGVLGPIVDLLQGTANVTAEQRQSMQAVKEAQPGIIGAYAESDRVTASSSGSFMGFNLGMVAGLHKGSILQMLQQKQ
ncbi:MAG TPA: FecR domain-containing protein [Bryobacteraceae bacterium]|nr:FecR domain-containing protein [Bryobacteraceae bacterium]